MSGTFDLASLQPYVRNPLPSLSLPWVAGVLGDHPSTYSRSPAMWNAAFTALGLEAAYVAFDVAPDHVDRFLSTCRTVAGLLGLNVTVPYKERALRHLDEVDPEARAIGAVNTIIRSPEGMLVGANTDGMAACRVLEGAMGREDGGGEIGGRVLLLGAGGAARAVGVSVAQRMAGVEILLHNRRRERAEEVAGILRRAGGRATIVDPPSLAEALAGVGAVVNTTPVGMAGPLRVDRGVVWLEPFSALAPAEPSPMPVADGDHRGSGDAAPPPDWWRTAWPEIVLNLEESLRRALRLRPGGVVLDLIYAPRETITLKHARWTGHQAMNGEGVLVGQAVEAFLRLAHLLIRGRDLDAARGQVERVMREALG